MKTAFHIIVVLFIMLPQMVGATKKVVLTTTEKEPYIGTLLLNNGFIYEIVQQAFERVGYEVTIQFLPPARAFSQAKRGLVDGTFPQFPDASFQEQFIFSDPMPGGEVGLLKRRTEDIQFPVKPTENLTKALQGLQNYRFGIVTGDSNMARFNEFQFLNVDYALTDEMNLLKLAQNRTDLIAIDKYTMGSLLVNKLPHLMGKFDFMNPPIFKQYFYVFFSKQRPDAPQKALDFNQGLQALQKDGTLNNILTAHGYR